MILYGDIGGTKTQLVLAENAANQLPEITYLQNADFSSFEQLLAFYLDSIDNNVQQAYFSIAGPVLNESCQLTNLDWQIDAQKLSQGFGFNSVHLLNDLAATAYAIPNLNLQDFLVLQNGLPILENGPIAVLSIGTGLGESVIFWEEELHRYRTISGEGGHKNFAPHNDLEFQLLKFLTARDGTSRFDTETLISGAGIMIIYQFLLQASTDGVDDSESQAGSPQEIERLADENPHGICHQTLTMFANLIASEASNIALQYLSVGGVVIAGGVPLKIEKYLQSPDFLQRFCDRDKFSDWLQTVPVSVCKNYHAPLIGTQYYSSLVFCNDPKRDRKHY